jgi:lysophospholipase L1-like esterase
VVIVVGLVFLIVGLPFALKRGGEPLSKAELERIDAAAASADAEDAAAEPPVVAFIGDSYTAGAGTTAPEKRFTTLVAHTQGWVEVNVGRGGTGYISPVDGDAAQVACGLDHCASYGEMIADAAAQQPEIVVVSGGRNELGKGRSASYRDGVAKFFADLRAALPDAQILVTSPIWDDDQAPDGLDDIADAVRAGAQAVGGTYLDIGEPLAGRREFVSADGVHPSDDGHAAIAQAVDAALAAAGLGKPSS